MRIYAKSAMKTENMDVKMKIGCDGIEIQLFDELVIRNPETECS